MPWRPHPPGISYIVPVPIFGCRSRLGPPDRRLDRSTRPKSGRPNSVSVPIFGPACALSVTPLNVES